MIIDKSILQAELDDCREQREEANRQIAHAKQVMSTATINIVGCNAVEKQLTALLEMADKPEPSAE